MRILCCARARLELTMSDLEFSPELAAEICRRIEETGNLRKVCRASDMPSEMTVRRWALEDVGGFASQYARAREIGYHGMADEIIDIADDSSGDVIVENGEARIDHENVQRSRLRADMRRWLLSKVLPKIYGDRLALTDADGGPLQVAVVRYDLPAPGDDAKLIEQPKEPAE